jgi:hypothetical protein
MSESSNAGCLIFYYDCGVAVNRFPVPVGNLFDTRISAMRKVCLRQASPDIASGSSALYAANGLRGNTTASVIACSVKAV